jgi:hypothetical protein
MIYNRIGNSFAGEVIGDKICRVKNNKEKDAGTKEYAILL